eukprot:441552_1
MAISMGCTTSTPNENNYEHINDKKVEHSITNENCSNDKIHTKINEETKEVESDKISDHCVWHLNSATPIGSILLCNGYIRNESQSSKIPKLIKQISINYFEENTAFNIVNDIQNIGKCITSEIFMIRKFKCMFKLYPNKFNLNENKCRLYIILVSIPPQIKTFTVHFIISLLNTNLKIEFCNKMKLKPQRTHCPTKFGKCGTKFDLNLLKRLQFYEFNIKINFVQINNKKSIMHNQNHYILNPINKQYCCHYQWIINDISKHSNYNKKIY